MGEHTQLGFEELIFLQELNEVYLLLDFISGRLDKPLSALDGMILDPTDGTKLSAPNVIARVSALLYPPAPPEAQKAQDAAFLLTLKDCLNCVAFPARAADHRLHDHVHRKSGERARPTGGQGISRLPGTRPRSAAEDAKPNRVVLAQRAFPAWSRASRAFAT